MTGQEALRQAVQRLRDAGVDDAARDARLLMATAMGLPTDRLTLSLSETLHPASEQRFAAMVASRERRQPVSQITGQRLFWGQVFRVTLDVLDPRPETETLVAAALERPFSRVLDLGTGSGCILLSCLKDMPTATGLGVDISAAALDVAAFNSHRLGLSDRCRFMVSDWCKAVEGQFDLILSNPPYIAAAEMPDLMPEVRDWEPHLALSPGGDGLDAYRNIAAEAPARLRPGGRIMVEIGPTQATNVIELFAAAGLERIDVKLDLDGRDRVVAAVKPA